jgi:hypothetical protein
VKRTLVLALFIAALVAPTAQAHHYLRVNSTTAYYEQRMVTRIGAYRIANGRWPLFDAFNLHLAGVALSWSNYNDAEYDTSIGPLPWQSWNDQFLTPDQQFFNAILTRIRCYGLPLTPYQVLESWKRRSGYRYALLNPTATTIGVRVVYVHRHTGWFHFVAGRCTEYIVIVAS